MLRILKQKREEKGSIGNQVLGLPLGEEISAKIACMKELQNDVKKLTKTVVRYIRTTADVEPIYPFRFEDWLREPPSGKWFRPRPRKKSKKQGDGS